MAYARILLCFESLGVVMVTFTYAFWKKEAPELKQASVVLPPATRLIS
jgi:hypothetical protein